jgi:hypothetical protein
VVCKKNEECPTPTVGAPTVVVTDTPAVTAPDVGESEEDKKTKEDKKVEDAKKAAEAKKAKNNGATKGTSNCMIAGAVLLALL